MPVPSKHRLILFFFLSLLIGTLTLELGLRAAGLVYRALASSDGAAVAGQYRILCLGESTTAPWLAGGAGDISWPFQLQRILSQEAPGRSFQVINQGIIGTNSAAQLSMLEDNLERYDPQMIVTMLGINDGGDTILYEDSVADKVVIFLQGFRIYKLFKVLGQRYPYHGREPTTAEDYLNQGLLAVEYTQYEDALRVFEKMRELYPEHPGSYFGLGRVFLEQERIDEAERMFLTAIEKQPGHVGARQYLGWVYHVQGRHEEAEREYRRAIELNPQDAEAYRALGLFYRLTGRADESREWMNRAESFEALGYDAILRHNYVELVDRARRRGARVIVMQYPLRDVTPLKKLFDWRDDVTYVSNKEAFREALEQASYDDLFIDFFAGDFGHCTARGNELIARNLARVILAEVEGT